MRPQEQLRIIEVVKIIHRVPGAEFDSLDFLQVHIIDLLRRGRNPAKTDTVKGFL